MELTNDQLDLAVENFVGLTEDLEADKSLDLNIANEAEYDYALSDEDIEDILNDEDDEDDDDEDDDIVEEALESAIGELDAVEESLIEGALGCDTSSDELTEMNSDELTSILDDLDEIIGAEEGGYDNNEGVATESVSEIDNDIDSALKGLLDEDNDVLESGSDEDIDPEDELSLDALLEQNLENI